tara:strand:+ start:23760 stop:25127 length:1368 start_codon:yes stop_codon:yes gene_type:complete
MKAKLKSSYVCSDCGASFPKWQGQCADCESWNTLTEIKETSTSARRDKFSNYSGDGKSIEFQNLSDISEDQVKRFHVGMSELDRVLGGGLVLGSVTLIGGDPGIGKSTLLLQALSLATQDLPGLYVSGEESAEQISIRAKRLNLDVTNLKLLTETNVENIINSAQAYKPKIIVLDSIQTFFSEELQSAPGTVSQVREAAAHFVRFAKQTSTCLFLVGHVTKDGSLAGPRILEHMVDTVLYFEGEIGSQLRLIRSIKNRFGAVNELGVFAMTDKGLKEVSNPSAIFLSRHDNSVSGSCILVTKEGTRPLMVEVQALVDQSNLSQPRRITLGIDQNRISMLLAILNRHGGVGMFDKDVFLNVVGGVKITEPAADLAVILAVYSSLIDSPLPKGLAVFGEVGLAGEIRPVPNGQDRIREAAKHGFSSIIIPKANSPKDTIKGLKIISVARLTDAIKAL